MAFWKEQKLNLTWVLASERMVAVPCSMTCLLKRRGELGKIDGDSPFSANAHPQLIFFFSISEMSHILLCLCLLSIALWPKSQFSIWVKIGILNVAYKACRGPSASSQPLRPPCSWYSGLLVGFQRCQALTCLRPSAWKPYLVFFASVLKCRFYLLFRCGDIKRVAIDRRACCSLFLRSTHAVPGRAT